jgi:hypothetical protein
MQKTNVAVQLSVKETPAETAGYRQIREDFSLHCDAICPNPRYALENAVSSIWEPLKQTLASL